MDFQSSRIHDYTSVGVIRLIIIDYDLHSKLHNVILIAKHLQMQKSHRCKALVGYQYINNTVTIIEVILQLQEKQLS